MTAVTLPCDCPARIALLAGLIGIVLNAVVSQMERRMLRWLPNVQED